MYDYSEEPRRDVLFIDVKSFYASVECIKRGLDPMTTLLIVMSKAENAGGLVLAASPMAKKVLGISNVTRRHEVPDHPELLVVPPRMGLYIQENLKIADILKQYATDDDFYPYSIDESMIDITHSWHLFGDSPWEVAEKIQQHIRHETGLVTTVCLGDNPVLAKFGMDLEAKKTPNFMSEWRYEDVPAKLWPIDNLTDIWGIGTKTAEKLHLMGIDSIYDVAHANPYRLKEKFGVLGFQLFAHSHGIDRTKVSDKLIVKEKSIGNSQILNYDYTNQSEIETVIREMADQVASRIRELGNQTECVELLVRYSRNDELQGFSKQLKITRTSNSKQLIAYCLTLFRKNYDSSYSVRQLGISYSKLVKTDSLQLDLFSTAEEETADVSLDFLVDKIRTRYGYASLVHASSMLDGATAISRRDHLIGGH